MLKIQTTSKYFFSVFQVGSSAFWAKKKKKKKKHSTDGDFKNVIMNLTPHICSKNNFTVN